MTSPFNGSQGALQGMAGRILGPTVFIALMNARGGLGIGRCLIDGGHDRTGARVGMLSSMYGTCAEVF